MVDFAKISFGWCKNTTIEHMIISKLISVIRAWIDEQSKINSLSSINYKTKAKARLHTTFRTYATFQQEFYTLYLNVYVYSYKSQYN